MLTCEKAVVSIMKNPVRCFDWIANNWNTQNSETKTGKSEVISFCSVRTLRIYVEPIDVEIEDDDGLQASALQMAFPGTWVESLESSHNLIRLFASIL